MFTGSARDVTKIASVMLAVTAFLLFLNDIRSVTAFAPIFIWWFYPVPPSAFISANLRLNGSAVVLPCDLWPIASGLMFALRPCGLRASLRQRGRDFCSLVFPGF